MQGSKGGEGVVSQYRTPTHPNPLNKGPMEGRDFFLEGGGGQAMVYKGTAQF